MSASPLCSRNRCLWAAWAAAAAVGPARQSYPRLRLEPLHCPARSSSLSRNCKPLNPSTLVQRKTPSPSLLQIRSHVKTFTHTTQIQSTLTSLATCSRATTLSSTKLTPSNTVLKSATKIRSWMYPASRYSTQQLSQSCLPYNRWPDYRRLAKMRLIWNVVPCRRLKRKRCCWHLNAASCKRFERGKGIGVGLL
jgi:hypothetical protein